MQARGASAWPNLDRSARDSADASFNGEGAVGAGFVPIWYQSEEIWPNSPNLIWL